MRNLLLLLLMVTSSFIFSQNRTVSTYKYGHNGMELIVKSKAKTIIVSTFNSKKEIKEEVAQRVYDAYKNNQATNGETITINSANAKVIGKLQITQKGKLTALNFFYESIEWNDGFVELYEHKV
jgi:hypothetical protein